MIGIFQGSPEGRANECQRRAKGGLPRATSKNRAKEGHGRAPSQKQGSLAAMVQVDMNLIGRTVFICIKVLRGQGGSPTENNI